MKKKVIISFIIGIVFFSFFQAIAVHAGDYKDTEFGLNTTIKDSGLPQEKKSPQALVGQIIGAVLSLVGVLFFALMIYAGILWMTARGNDQTIEKAKDLITYAVIGLIVILSAYAITSYIGSALTSSR